MNISSWGFNLDLFISQDPKKYEKSFDVIIANLDLKIDLVYLASSYSFLLKAKLQKLLKPIFVKFYSALKENGNLWIFCQNIVYDEITYPLMFDIASLGKESNFKLKNLIKIFCNPELNSAGLPNSYFNLLFFVKNLQKYTLNKDPLREKAFWKNIEWGKGERKKKNNSTTRSLYHEKGKDPSNFWINRLHNGKGRHEWLSNVSNQRNSRKVDPSLISFKWIDINLWNE